jgi:sulfide:quinone oxidoreductase
MKTLLILGAGTGGTMVANRMARTLNPAQWRIIVVDKDEAHIYQPGLIFIPFGLYSPADVVRPKQHFLPDSVELIFSDITRIDPVNQTVFLGQALRTLHYDQLVIATGAEIAPEQTPGLLDGGGWGENIFDFYTLEGASKLSGALDAFTGGRLVLNVAGLPFKGPAAPLEFLFHADAYFRKRDLRENVELIYATPNPGPFTDTRADPALAEMLAAKGIQIEANFFLSSVDSAARKIIGWDGREIGYDLLVTIPVHVGARFVREAGLGDEQGFVRADKFTLQAAAYPNIWAIGDAAGIPAMKTSSAAHFQLETVIRNIERVTAGDTPLPSFDGRANFFIESGDGKAMLIDLNYGIELLPGGYPLASIGPFRRMQASRLNHMGKLAYRWVYWNVLLKDRDLPAGSSVSSDNPQASAGFVPLIG